MASDYSAFTGSIPEHYDRGLGPVLFEDFARQTARRAAALTPSRVLELAAGTDIVSRHLRADLPAGAHLTVTDLNPAMLEIARAKLASAERVTITDANAMALPFADGSFDLIVCQYGVMFFPDRVASYREAARLLAPGGRYLFTVWGPQSANPFSAVTSATLHRLYPDNPPGFMGFPFSYGDPARVKADLAAAGWTEVEHVEINEPRTVQNPAAFVDGLLLGSPVSEELRKREIPIETVLAALLGDLLDRFGPEPVTMPLQTHSYLCTRTA